MLKKPMMKLIKIEDLIPLGHSIEEIEFFRLAFNADESRLPCPFCGHAPNFWPDLEYERMYISCPNCTCEVHGDTVRECFERWNRRKVASASLFVSRLSSQFDKGKIRELTPELKDRLLDSFNVLHDYGTKAPWARREADFASSLLAFIPRAREEMKDR